MIIDTDTTITIEQTQAFFRALIFGPNAALDADGNLSVAGNLSSDKGTWVGKHFVPTILTIADLPTTIPDSDGIFIVSDALNPLKGGPAIAGGNTSTLVNFDKGAWLCL